MYNLTEKDIKKVLPENGDRCGVLTFKKLKCQQSYQLSRKMTVNGKTFSGFKAGKSYDLWCVGVRNNTEVLVFIPGADQEYGFVFGRDVFGDWDAAPEVFKTSCGGEDFVLIANYLGEQLLVPLKCLFPDNVWSEIPTSTGEGKFYGYWRPEFVSDGKEWFFGVAFYPRVSNLSLEAKKQFWQAFFRVDTQSWLPKGYDAQKPALVKVALSTFPVEVGNYRVQFVQEIIKFSFV